jgi:prolyl-tRNA synthetase
MGALIMAHSDDEGLVLPPKLAPIQIVIVPIYKGDQITVVAEKAREIEKMLKDAGFAVKLDDRDTHKPGWKFAEYELKGIPVRIALGPRDVENNTVELARRDTKTKEVTGIDGLVPHVRALLQEMQQNIYRKALDFRDSNIRKADSYDHFRELLDQEGGFILAHWDGTPETEAKIKEETKATIRCIPLDQQEEKGKCIYSGKESNGRVIFARAY